MLSGNIYKNYIYNLHYGVCIISTFWRIVKLISNIMQVSVTKELTNFRNYFGVVFCFCQRNGYVCLRGQRNSMSPAILSASHGLSRIGLD